MVSPALGSALVWCCQQGVYLILFQIRHGGLNGLFERDIADFPAPGDLLRRVHGNEVAKRMNDRQSLIASCDCIMSSLLKVAKEETNMVGREMLDGQSIDGTPSLLCQKRQKQDQAITVT